MDRKLGLTSLRGGSAPAALAALVALAATFAACSASQDDGSNFTDGDDAASSSTTGTGGAGAGGASDNSGGAPLDPSTSSTGGKSAECDEDPDTDWDGDGVTEAEGDCNDCDVNVSPGAIEVIVVEGEGGAGGSGGAPPAVDEDCDGVVDNPPLATCDDALLYTDGDPYNAAKAIELCQEATTKKWGVAGAAYTHANGSAFAANNQVGLLSDFGAGVSVQAGSRMLALSSGRSRLPGHPDACTSNSCSTTPNPPPPLGYPQDVPNCPVSDVINDDMALQLDIKAPSNATGYKFRFKFYSFEYAEYVCTTFNDQFVALVEPPPMGANNGNISFDSAGNPVSVNIAFFDVCDETKTDFAGNCYPAANVICPPQPVPYCPLGTAELMGNGFLDAFGSGEDGGGTAWLQTTAPVTGGEIFQIRFSIWDVGDSSYDSTVLVDGFEWIAQGGTPFVGTEPIPDPK
jgi:hypothetical protein